MAELSIKNLKKRFKKCEIHKDNWRAIYEEAYEFALPMRNLYDGYYEADNVPGQFAIIIISTTARVVQINAGC